MFKKILIANRGEIAVRILRACREMGISPVAVYSDADRASLHVLMAEEAYPIGPSPSSESYLVTDKIIGAASYSGCDALHPGYGFLAENPELVRACEREGITFIGPSAAAMERLGSKTAARQLAREAGVPTVPGTLDPVAEIGEAKRFASEIGYPVVLKAVAGGGGKGMRLVQSDAELATAWRDASSEAQNAFGDSRLYLEKLLLRPRHIEMQILGDRLGHLVYLGERECSIQRRYQKVMEEAPSPVMTAALREKMGEAAVKLARAGGYYNAGTLEFLVDAERQFYFLEMNTRLQVEHPVTEQVTSLDLVKLQIRIAAGEPLRFTQEDVVLRGHSIQCRIYAEDPDNNFFPSPGNILEHRAPAGPGIRLDDGVYAGWMVPNEYDPLLGKLIVTGSDRSEAIARLRRALSEYFIGGITTNIGLFRKIVDDSEFVSGAIHTKWLDEWLGQQRRERESAPAPQADAAEDVAALAAALWHVSASRAAQHGESASEAPSRWKIEGRIAQLGE
ncbi:MAG: acetyl-CoA carboxylase biotin carboxylase subunit [Candidatus Acidiferrales bacterium]